jgi:DNA-binding IclR family transcriptional regulator
MTETSSFERMLALLDLFTEHRPDWTPEALMARLGYSRPTLYRYLKTLRDAGLIVGRPNSGFTIGPKVVEMDYLLRRSDPLVLDGGPALRRLAGLYPCTVFIARWYGDKVLCVLSEQSATDLTSSYPRGRPMPIARGATSRSILAFLPRRRLMPLIESRMEDFREIGFGTTPAEVLKGLIEVRRAGVAFAHAEVTPGVVGVAAPIFDGGPTPVASLTLAISEKRAEAALMARIARDVQSSAATLTEMLAHHRIATLDA